jgi:dipeptidyl aminopeptidase/acylaminoacyl peptidase
MSAPLTKVERIPLDVLFGNPERTSPQISPDGERLAYLAPVDGVLNVWLGTPGTDDFVPVTKDTDRGIRSYAFAHDNRHLLYIQDQGGDENWRLYTVDLETGDVVDRTPFDAVQARIVAMHKRRPHELLLGLNVDDKQLHGVYHLDLRTGGLEKVAENPGFLAWLVDYDFQLRGAYKPTGDGGRELLVRDTPSGEWRTVFTFDFEDGEMSGPIGFTRDGRSILIRSAAGANAARLVRLDLDTGAEEAIVGDPTYDVMGVFRDPDTWELQIVTFLKDRQEILVVDDALADEIAAIRAIEDGELSLPGRDDANAKWVVSFQHDDGPTRFHLWDRASKQATFLFADRSDLDRYQLAKMEPIWFAARDALEVHGYITFPVGAERSNLPCVLMVHGGPWSRDVWGFDPYAQWMANRGWVCLQINYRGSIGYGNDFVNAGDREWATKMHDDLLDGIDWAVEQGYIDRDRVAIMGGSYGGYAALVGATFTPDTFRCAVDIVGPSNLITLIESFPPYWKPNIARWHRRVGNPETDRDFLWSRSPLSRVDDIKVPMLIGQGANDPRVTQIESEQIVNAMKAKGIDHEYLLFADEGHGFAKPENRLRFMEAADAFLAKHL